MNRERPLILAVDDEPGTLALLRKLLTHLGYDVIEAVDGWSAIRTVAEHRPDLVCLATRPLARLRVKGKAQAIAVTRDGKLVGVADPRSSGKAAGE